ncbi:MAG: D-inositol 3-phosphate glycosyltransferase [Smithella sp. PtaU1.Bin162]|nr:MAG: D-inositol 3-phosphate glycosyltransferase [Smithella sp. PtaU1.Bin162]
MGGQELRILDQIRWLCNHGHSAWLLARKDSAIYHEAEYQKLPAYPIPIRGSVNPQAIFRLMQFVQSKKIDILDCHSASAASTAFVARLFTIPVVRTLHYDFETDTIHKYLLRYGSDHFITVAHWIADKLIKLKCADHSMVSIIPTGIDLNRFSPEIDKSSVRNEFNIPESTTVISAIAMIRPDKGHKYLIRAVDRIADVNNNIRVIIVGSATRNEYLDELKKEIAAIRHQDKVILAGFRQDIEKVIAASDVVVNSSIYEPRSQVIHQAFAMKKLVIASSAGGNKESIAHSKTGFLFYSENVESLSQTILSILGNNTEQIRERAYQLALSEHSIDTMMERTLNIYNKILKDKQSLHCVLLKKENINI